MGQNYVAVTLCVLNVTRQWAAPYPGDIAVHDCLVLFSRQSCVEF